MLKRLFWLVVGVGVGVLSTVWAIRALRIRVLQTRSGTVAAEVTTSVRRLGSDLRDALDEGRLAMREREAELRGQLAGDDALPPALLPSDPAPEIIPLRPRARVRATRGARVRTARTASDRHP